MARLPSPLVMLSVVAVAVAGVAFVVTNNEPATERKVEQAVIASSTPTPTPSATATKTPKPPPPIRRGEVYVVVFNNSGIKGLAAQTADKATQIGWTVVGEDNWYGNIPATTVYYPERLKRAAKQLALDLGIERTAPAVEPMQMDRLTVVLTGQ